ncbi:hypothetical protein K502DRAFT_324627 [Neoconidiobolus thromboides FSU 785]|nr:hypothetical protein K502DRAFT_324627 [Neoconidiobolus thromboides FSU 785]
MLLHNLALAIYSFATFASLFITIYTAVSNSDSLYDTYCDKNQVVWTQSLYFNTWLFYLSKYWEFIDTLILIVKNKVPSLLQCYHHSGAVLGMFYLFNSSSPGAWIFVLLNSLIHTIMYMYYFFTILGYRPKFKKYITGLQLTQFVVGSCLAIPYFIWPECISLKQKLAIAFNLVYVVPLIYLFMKFAKETYTVKNKKN